MILSMTGFGKATHEYEGKNIVVEIRTLNSKQFDVSTRIPNVLKEKDLYIRNFLKQYLIRGKVDFSLSIDTMGKNQNTVINTELIKHYYQELYALSSDLQLDIKQEQVLATLMKMPDVLSTKAEVFDENLWDTIQVTIQEATNSLIRFRKDEGRSLKEDLLTNVATIEQLLSKVNPFEKERIETVKSRLKEQLNTLEIETDGAKLEQELVYYLDKFDINEEKVRLQNHCNYFKETVCDEEESVGRKLNFIAQEIGREINTLGSKANHTEITKLVVEMKEALERIKEQVLNVL